MSKALFLDRDGVINIDYGYVCHHARLKLKKDTIAFLKKIPQDYKIFIVTNQSGIARGYYDIDQYLSFQSYVEKLLLRISIRITKTYFCPYHPDFPADGKFDHLKCDRKPCPGMIMKAANEYNIDIPNSVLIGDNISDVMAGKKAGINNLYLLTEDNVPTSDWYSTINNFEDVRLVG